MKINKQQTGSGTKIALIVSGVVLLACIVLTVLVGLLCRRILEQSEHLFEKVLVLRGGMWYNNILQKTTRRG